MIGAKGIEKERSLGAVLMASRDVMSMSSFKTMSGLPSTVGFKG